VIKFPKASVPHLSLLSPQSSASWYSQPGLRYTKPFAAKKYPQSIWRRCSPIGIFDPIDSGSSDRMNPMSDKLCCARVYTTSFSSYNVIGCISIYGSTLLNYSTFAKCTLTYYFFASSQSAHVIDNILPWSGIARNLFSSWKTFVHLLFDNMLGIRHSSVGIRLCKQCTLD
jgi:hypothetical protein